MLNNIRPGGFPERILYCEGKTNVSIPIDHAFNKVGDAYIDITFEFALHENPSIYEYVTFGEYDAKTPGVINQYAPGEFYAVTESDIWLMRYHKNILFAVNCKTTRKNKFEIKVFIFGN